MLTAEAQYAANLATLRQQPAMLPLLAQLEQTPLTNVQLAPTSTGALMGCAWDVHTQTWIPLCGVTDPMTEAEQAMGQIWSREQTVFTLLGIGMGYAIAAFAKRLLPYQRLIVWDPEATFFKAMLYAVDIPRIFSGKRIEIYVGNDVLQRIEPWYLTLEVHEKLHMAFPVSHSYTGIYRKADYDAVMQRCMEMIRFHMVGLATWRQFGRCIGDNDLENMPEYYQNPGINALKGLWPGKPAVCVAAGPSLQRNLRLLLPAEQRAKVALISVGTTYALLQGLGLQPDIVTTIDFQRLNWTDQFQHIPLDPDCALVYLHSTYPQTVRRWPGPMFVAENASDTMAWIKQFAGEDKGSCGQVQTVAHLNVLVALALGANPIIMLGQDLSMPATEHHAVGSRAQDTAPADVAPEAFLDATDMYGQPVKTRHSFQSMLLVFERIIAEHPATTFFNCSEQGLHIKGAHHMPLAQVLAQLAPLESVGVHEARPAFQGETARTLQQRRSSPLRAAVRSVYTHYEPKTVDTLLEAFQKLCDDVEAVGAWAHQTRQRWESIQALYDPQTSSLPQASREAALSAEVLSYADTLDMLLEPRYQEIVASEKTLQDCGHATGMYVIRRFDFIELKGEIPPPPETFTESWHHARYAASRLARAATMFLDELPALRRLLRHTAARLRLDDNLVRAIAKQQYRHALHAVTSQGSRAAAGTPPAAHLRVLANILRHTQQYAAALAVMEAWNQFRTSHTPGTVIHARRIREHLARYSADVRHALPAYFVQPFRAPDDTPLGDMTYAWHHPVRTAEVPHAEHGSLPMAAVRPSPLSVLAEALSAINGVPVTTNGHSPVPPPVQEVSGSLVHG